LKKKPAFELPHMTYGDKSMHVLFTTHCEEFGLFAVHLIVE